MIKILKTIIVEGNYDKIKLSGIVDAHIIATNGFQIFKDDKMRSMICSLAEKNGIIILTDSDRAGFLIRNHIKGFVKKGEITNLYIPDVPGKEKRKKRPGKEGLLGVEGMDDEILIKLLSEADCKSTDATDEVSYFEFYSDGYAGGNKSSYLRACFAAECSLPKRLSAKELLAVINRLYTPEEYRKITQKIAYSAKADG